MKTTITKSQFECFISQCTVSYEGDSYDSKGTMMDPEGNETFASINYDTDNIQVLNQVWISDDEYLVPTDEQQAFIIEEIHMQTMIEREGVKELRNEPSCKYELFGVNPMDFI